MVNDCVEIGLLHNVTTLKRLSMLSWDGGVYTSAGLLQGISFVPSCRYTGSSKEIVETRYSIEEPVFSQASDYCLYGLQDQRWIPTDPV